LVQERQGAKRTRDVLQSLPVALQQLKALIEMSKTWQEQHDALLLFLASSPLRPTLPTEMPSSSLPDPGLQVPPLSSPPPLPNAAQRRALLSDATIPCTSSPGLSAGTPSVTSLNTAQEAVLLSDTTIPCTYSEGNGSPSPLPSLPPLEEPVDLLPSTTMQTLCPILRRLPTAIKTPALPRMHAFSSLTSGKDRRAKELVDNFCQTSPQTDDGRRKRAEIRKQAKEEGLHSLFNSLLNSHTLVRSQFAKPPRFIPPPELRRSERE
jgi:hypothetical protein